MNKRKLLALAALATLALSSCTNQEDPADRDNSLLPADRVIRVSATAASNHLVPTRAGMDTEQLNLFSLTIANEDAPAYSYENVYMKKEVGIWYSYEGSVTGNIPLPLLWSNANHTVKVTAYQPYVLTELISDGVITGAVNADQTYQGGGGNSDLLWAQNDVTPANPDANNAIHYDPTTKSLVVKMNHRMSKLHVNLKYGTALTQGSGDAPTLTAATLIGTRRQYSFTPATGEVAVNPYSSLEDIAMSITTETPASGFDAACEAIVVPQDGAFTLRFTIDGYDYEYVYPEAYTFASGTLYTLNLTVGPDLPMGKITSRAWSEE